MNAVLGILFIGIGAFMAYYAITGNVPTFLSGVIGPTTAATTGATTPVIPSAPIAKSGAILNL